MVKGLGLVRFAETLAAARESQASDVHFCAGREPVMRIHGELHAGELGAFEAASLREAAETLLGPRELDALRCTGDATIGHEDAAYGAVRIHVYTVSGEVSIAVRMLAAEIPSLGELRLPQPVIDCMTRRYGLIVFAGPTGSGKSTALASLIDHTNHSAARHIITIEDPIEYRHHARRSIISQRQVGNDAQSFAVALRGALRSDPDIILIGEMRDRATMHAALTAAETGHLVLCTLHTGNAAESVDRIIGSFEGRAQDEVRTQLAGTLIAIVCLRLVPCANRAGRVAAAEVMIATDAVRSAIRDAKPHQLRNIIATSRACGMQTLESHLGELVLRGEITFEAACNATDRPGEIRRLEAS